MQESARTIIERNLFNLIPCYRGSGGRLIYVAKDYSKVTVKLPLNWRTRNYVGTIYGGSMYGAIDPLYMMMLIKRLGKEYIVWDKAASIQFKKPGRTTLFCTFEIDDNEINSIKELLVTQEKLDRNYCCDLVDENGNVYATAEKLLYIRKNDNSV